MTRGEVLLAQSLIECLLFLEREEDDEDDNRATDVSRAVAHERVLTSRACANERDIIMYRLQMAPRDEIEAFLDTLAAMYDYALVTDDTLQAEALAGLGHEIVGTPTEDA